MTSYERQLSAIQMLSGIDSKKSADDRQSIPQTDDEWTEDQECEAFLYTSKVNSAKFFANYL